MNARHMIRLAFPKIALAALKGRSEAAEGVAIIAQASPEASWCRVVAMEMGTSKWTAGARFRGK